MTDAPIKPSVTFVTIEADRAGQRLDNFLLGHLTGVPKSLIYRIVRKGEVRINKGRVKVDYRLRAGDVVRIPPVKTSSSAPPPAASGRLRELLEASVLYEDSGVMVMNKPSGLAVHGGSGISLGLIEALRQMRDEKTSLELVHRLDRDTSGCILVAKKRSVLRHLHQQLRDGQVNKVYHALVEGQWSKHCGQVKVPLKKNELSSGERVVRADPEGKESLTLYRVLERFSGCSLVEAKPVTGRTHQIRVHCQFEGHAIIGDTKYGRDDVNRSFKRKGAQRLFLHAAALDFTLPDGQPIHCEAPKGDELESLLSTLRAES